MAVGTRIDTADIRRCYLLADVMARHGIDLRRSGGRLVGRCPFHDDRDPSLTLYVGDPTDEHFHCFGCRAHGDVIRFVELIERLPFRAAVAALTGEDTGVRSPPRTSARTSARRDQAPRRRSPRPGRPRLPGHRRGALPPPVAGRSNGVGLLRRARARPRRRRAASPRLRAAGRRARPRCGAAGAQSDDRRRAAGGPPRPARPRVPGRADRHPGGARRGPALGDRPRPGRRGRGPAKYLHLPGPRPLLGLAEVGDRREVYLAEGPFDRLALSGWGLPALALAGTHAAPAALDLLGRFERVFLTLDNDDAGRAATTTLREALGTRAVPRPVARREGRRGTGAAARRSRALPPRGRDGAGRRRGVGRGETPATPAIPLE